MSLWIVLVFLALIAAGLVALPFLRPRPADAPPTDAVEIMKAEVARVELDQAVGELDATAAAAEKLEAERRLLAAATAPKEAPLPPSQAFDRVTAGIVVGAVVLGATVLYAAMGKPSIPSAPAGLAGAPMEPVAAPAMAGAGTSTQGLPDVDTMIARLQARLQAQPSDAEGWRMLGWSYFSTQKYPQAVQAYARAVALNPTSAGYQSAYGEAMAQAAGGQVSPEARKAFEAALKLDPADTRAKSWLTQGGPPPATSTAAPPPSAPTGAAPIPADQMGMISSMIERQTRDLAANPRDAEGWVRLIRSRTVLGQPDLARKALADALAAFKDDPVTQQHLRETAHGLGVS